MKVAFHSHGLTLRGSEVALLDYAVLNREVLGNDSLIVVRDRPGLAADPVLRHWREKVPCAVYENPRELPELCRRERVEVFYQIKPGRDDGFTVAGVRNCIHAMFPATEFHGDRYAYVSRWLGRVMTGREDRFVPHRVSRLESGENLRAGLGIPAGAKVFGRHGGADTFNIPCAQRAVLRHARAHPEDHFLFLNTDRFGPARSPGNLHFLPATAEPAEKAKFLASCDAMLHARLHGETFGLAVGEFAVLGKPVITFAGSRERAHLEMLGDRARLYRDQAELEQILAGFRPATVRGTEYEDHADPVRVMDRFRECFLD